MDTKLNVKKIEEKIKDLKDKKQYLLELSRKEFQYKNKTKIKIMDWLIIIMILSNIGAIMITNAMVTKSTPDIKFIEVNPVQAKMSGYESMNNVWLSFKIMFRSLFFYGILVGTYIYTRFRIRNQAEYYLYLAVYSAAALILFMDFTNDLGFLIGKMIS